MTKPCIHIVAGARPNFMKIAPMVRALQADGRLAWKIVHTGQHFDRNMSDVFFEELGIPAPDVHFNCGGGSHATQTARIMEAFEQHCANDRPDAVVVVGDDMGKVTVYTLNGVDLRPSGDQAARLLAAMGAPQ